MTDEKNVATLEFSERGCTVDCTDASL